MIAPVPVHCFSITFISSITMVAAESNGVNTVNLFTKVVSVAIFDSSLEDKKDTQSILESAPFRRI